MGKLIPPDKKQCQAECLEGSFIENNPASDGEKDSMSLCDDCLPIMIKKYGGEFAASLCDNCLQIMIKKYGGEFATISPIKRRKPKCSSTR